MRRLIGGALAAAAMLATGALSRAPYSPQSSDTALLRLSWRTRAEARQACRDRTPEELAKLPAHMRTPQICTPIPLRYQLSIQLDDGPVIVRDLHAAGARADRPVYVLRELPLTPGRHRIHVEFRDPAAPEADRLRLRRRVVVRPGDIVLVTYDHERRELYIPNRAHDD